MMVKNGDLPWYKVNSSLETNPNTLLGGMTGPQQIPRRTPNLRRYLET